MIKMLIACLLLIAISINQSHAGPLRERIKDRWVLENDVIWDFFQNTSTGS